MSGFDLCTKHFRTLSHLVETNLQSRQNVLYFYMYIYICVHVYICLFHDILCVKQASSLSFEYEMEIETTVCMVLSRILYCYQIKGTEYYHRE